MSLYDDFDKHRTTEKVAGWSSGIKLLQSQLQLKKAATTQPKREQFRKAAAVLAPVIDLKSKVNRDGEKDEDSQTGNSLTLSGTNNVGVGGEFDWNVVNEYDPMWPNEYEKVVKELRDIRDREHDQENELRKRRRDTTRFEDPQTSPGSNTMVAPERDEERTPTSRGVGGGAAIAPPPSLQEAPDLAPPPPPARPQASNLGYGASSVAAKIMAKYGFKEGQGLGKKEQGMSVALQVEKTSKRGGRIVGEREQLMPPPPPMVPSPPLPVAPVPQPVVPQEEPSITEIMKSPSKVVLLRNMVGPGEVDEDLEPEVKDECNTKYGDVSRVMIHEVMDVPAEEAVRIFVEFKRIESAIKAVVDLNGRFFGGRQVRAGFYSCEKLDTLQLMD
ncbi:splicing factor 45 [Neodiprion pinetum]|uniref:Splicing factor 45 n=1 Tax=Neodiprion lecontei TaxID=441921 RepID=A0A6J0BJS7_NEOLC|nr:splicing factor 45 [Neodiprion lecontei]XP_046419642.1 splicing factor 45 [Neodiprion fabricii]XP_046478527.1 splicing factor 45 [Neodiprion pinetum]XP_046611500.1 splicing factor 45 [Neodiprion virginianus]